jgi:alkaline phosphatase D
VIAGPATALVILCLAAALEDVPRGADAASPDHGLLVTVGDVTPTSARLWAWPPTPGPLWIGLGAPGVQARAVETLAPAADGPVRATLRNLDPGRRYRYRLEAAGEAVDGEFVTPPAPGDAAPVRIAWSGDLGSRGHCRVPDGWPVFHAIVDRRPDVFVFVGDTIYADHRCGAEAIPGADFTASTLEEFRARHRYNRADPAVQRLFRATSVLATWDDHDVRSNFAGPAERLTPTGLRAFLEAWPVATPPGEPTRLHRSVRWGRLVEIFVLDTRQHRSANWRRDGPGKSMLGAEQRRWLVDALAASTATWKVVVSSVPLSIAKGWPFGDSWARRRVLGYETGFAAERDALLAEVQRRGVRQLIVLAADVHYGALMTHRPLDGPEVHELIAGPLAARPKRPASPGDDLRTTVHAQHGGMPTFGEMAVTAAGLTARLFDASGKTLAEVGWRPP